MKHAVPDDPDHPGASASHGEDIPYMQNEEREMVAELLNWIAECGEETTSTTPMTDRAASLFGLYRTADHTWHLRPGAGK
jgi:hypothetical protein